MNRRTFLGAVAAVPVAAIVPKAAARDVWPLYTAEELGVITGSAWKPIERIIWSSSSARGPWVEYVGGVFVTRYPAAAPSDWERTHTDGWWRG